MYIEQLLNKFEMDDCNIVSTLMEQNLNLPLNQGISFEDPTKYKQLVGSLNFLTTTRFDVAFSIGILSKFMHQPCEGHWITTK